MGEAKCICRKQFQPLLRVKMGCQIHDPNRMMKADQDLTDEPISRDLNADRVPEPTREEASCDTLSLPCAPEQIHSNAKSNANSGASFSGVDFFARGVLGERPSGPLWQVNNDGTSHRLIVRGFGLAFAVDPSSARALHYQLGVALNLRRAGA